MDRSYLAPSTRWLGALLLPAAILALAPSLLAQSDEAESYMGESPSRYAEAKIVEGDVRIRKSDAEEALSRGVPVAEGDVVESHGRGVLQLADGTRVAFGSETRIQVAALFMDQNHGRQVLLRLDYGRIRVSVGRDSDARIRVDTPSGSGTLEEGGCASFEVEQDRTTRVRVQTGRMYFSNEQDRATIRAGERLTVYSNHDQLDRIRDFNTYDNDSFDDWCDHTLVAHRGASWDKVPSELRHYSDDLDDHGEWVYVNECQNWCWRPVGVVAEWRPYWQGRWGCYPGGMTWVSEEPWGYVTYHHGRWGWGAGLGWYWIPGVYYAPAWVAWQTNDAYFGWAPLGYYNYPCAWGYGPWGGGYCWNVVQVNYINVYNVHHYCNNQPGVLRGFNPGTGGTVWNGGPNRPVTHPWSRGPLVLNRNEFRDPAQIQRVVQDRSLNRERVQAYERQASTSTGRTIYHRDMPGTPMGEGPRSTAGTSPQSAPFEDRGRLRGGQERPETPRESPRTTAPSTTRDRPSVDRYREPRSTPSRSETPRDTGGSTERRDLPRERTRVEPTPEPTRSLPRTEPRYEPSPTRDLPKEDRTPQRHEERPSKTPRSERPSKNEWERKK